MLRTHTLGEIDESLEGKRVKLAGWVERIREHGKLIFIDLRDRYGKVQAVIDSKCADFQKAKQLTLESCIGIEGIVKRRPSGTENPNLKSGKVEIAIDHLEIFNISKPLPFDITRSTEVEEEVRMKWRFLDLRNPKLQQNLILRHKIIKAFRDFFDAEGFIEVETPMLGKSTPEGARDYIVPSRVHPGKFYALPQSPQLYKQLLMVAGYDRYFQIARCLRDEDLRADRQPEFTQLDIEMSFVTEDDIFDVVERALKYVFKKIFNIDIKIPFRRLDYDYVMKKYHTDKPDLRQETGEEFAFAWIVNFPLFEWSEEEKRYVAAHHPFCFPSDLELLKKDPYKVKARTYDLVLNGVELLSGSIRIHKPELQMEVFRRLGISEEEARRKFGFMLDAFSYGAPPHGGCALGLDRFIQVLVKAPSIREVIAFPKNKEARDLMLDCPSPVSEQQLREVHIKILEEEKGERKEKEKEKKGKEKKEKEEKEKKKRRKVRS
ncbi:MAG: aspartate--tRNA ligase [Candidatus Pacearchaeota archaeon]